MNSGWHSSSTEILLNPKIPKEALSHYIRELEAQQLKGHVWVATSGTSGHFKFVALAKEALLFSAEAVNRHLQSDSTDCWIHALPDFHVGGLGIFARAYCSRASVVKMKKWEPSSFFTLAKESQATLSALVPTQLYDLVQIGKPSPPSLRAVIIGGGRLDLVLEQKARELGWPILLSYGLTECCSQVATVPLQSQSGKLQLLDHVKVRIQEERVAIKSDSLFTCYLDVLDDRVHRSDPKKEGWFLTEDLGEFDERGTLHVKGRVTDVVKVYGENVNIHYLQCRLDALRLELGVATPIILGAIDDARAMHQIVAYVEGEGSALLETLFEQLNASLLPFERVREVVFLEKLPRNAVGKVDFKAILG